MSDDPRNKVLKKDAAEALSGLRSSLHFSVKIGRVTADAAFAAYQDALTQVCANETAWEESLIEYNRLRCRDCGHTTSVPKSVDKWACRHKPSEKRETFIDMVDDRGAYIIDVDAPVTTAA